MRISISHTLSVETADVFGEWLRDKFFVQYPPGRLGCCDTFNMWGQVEPLDDFIEKIDWLEYRRWNRSYQFCQGYRAVMAWTWCGILDFNIDDEFVLSNADCKKTNGWTLKRFSKRIHKHLSMP